MRTPEASGVPALPSSSGRACWYDARLPEITYADFDKVDIRVGRIVRAEAFPEARKPAYKLQIDFGPEIGVKRSSAQLTKHYRLDELEGRLVLGVVNFPSRQIGPVRSEVLTLGVPDETGAVVLVVPSTDVPIGGRLF
jgi:tRNA-binding protein